ncbi:MAG: hypothetical protein R3Y66_08620 [Rikenellaceae bacterium]
MKRYIVMMAVAMAAICTSCSKDDEVTQVAPPTTSTNSEVTIKFSTDEITTTRAFFDESAESEAWEKSISKATLLIERYDDTAQTLIERIYRVLTSDQIAAGSITVGLTGANTGDLIVVAVGANFDIPEGTAALAVERTIINTMDMTEYNGPFEQVSTGSIRPDGFVLFGYNVLEVVSGNAIVADLQLKRQVVKIAIQATISDNFNNPSVFLGDLRVDDITVRSTDYYDYNFDYCFSFNQASYKSGSYYQNLFYIDHCYRNDFTVSATYDADGNFNTTTDQTSVTYVFSIMNDYGGMIELLDNQYYRVNLTINSMETTDVSVSISVADWVSVEDQTVEIG